MFIVYAHRGASHYAPENTMSSFYMGFRMGANGIETDVRRTKDGVLVLFHDKDLVRTCGIEGSVNDYTYEELLRFRVYNPNTNTEDIIVKFEDFLHYFAFRDLTFAIELKEAGLASEVTDLLDRYALREKCYITSFEFDYIKEVKALRPDYRVGLLTKEVNGEILAALKEIGAEQICPRAKLLTQELVDYWHSLGFEVRAWGVKTPEEMRNTYDFGTEGTTINYPEQLITYMTLKQ